MFSHRTRPTPRPHRIGAGLEQLDCRITPAVAAVADTYQAAIGSVLTIPAERGLLANDFSTTNFGAVLTATYVPGSAGVEDSGGGGLGSRPLAQPLPPNTVVVNPDGSLTLTIPSNLPVTAEFIFFDYIASNAQDPTEATGRGGVTINLTRPTGSRFAVSPKAGAEPLVNVYDATTNTLVQSIMAYEPQFTGGVRVAVADFTADGVPDVATAPGVGGGSRIKLFDGRTGRVLFDQFVFESAFNGGAYVGFGDVNGDSYTDLIVGAGVGGGPRVVVINGQSFVNLAPGFDNPFFGPVLDQNTGQVFSYDILADFFAYEDSFRGGVKVAGGDIEGVGRAFVVTAPGDGGGPVVKTFDYNQIVGPPSIIESGAPGNITRIRQPLNNYAINFGGTAVPSLSFLAGDATGRTGVNISTADADGDGRADIVTGDTTAAAVVSIFDGRSGGLLLQFGVPFEASPTSGVVTGSLTGPTGILISPTTAPNSLVPSQPNPVTITTGNNLSLITNGLPIASGGVTVLGIDVDGDGADEIVTGAGPGNAARVNVFKPNGTRVSGFLAFPANVLSGINVG